MHTKDDLKRIGDIMIQWHEGSRDPVYAVGSFFISGKEYQDVDVVRRALSNLERLMPQAQLRLNGWGPTEVKDLRIMIFFLRKYIAEKMKKSGGGGAKHATHGVSQRHKGGGGAMYHDIHRPQAPKIRIVQVRLSRDGYTSEGRYFGTGKPLYEVTYAESGDYVPLGAHWGNGFIRAHDREDAKSIVRGIVADARF